MASSSLFQALVLWSLVASVRSTQMRLRGKQAQNSSAGPFDDFYPDQVLCTLGKNDKGLRNFFPWCVDWVKCIQKKAEPEGTPEAVLKAWGPADCRAICGLWPAPQPTTTKAPTTTAPTTKAPTTAAPTTTTVSTPKPRYKSQAKDVDDKFNKKGDGRQGYQMLPYGTSGCPKGLEIKTKEECTAAAESLGLPAPATIYSQKKPYGPRLCISREKSHGYANTHFNPMDVGIPSREFGPICHKEVETEWRGDPGHDATTTAKPPAAKPPTCPPWVSKAECERQAKLAQGFLRVKAKQVVLYEYGWSMPTEVRPETESPTTLYDGTESEKEPQVVPRSGALRANPTEVRSKPKAALLDLSQRKTDSCVQSCENFKKTFSTCVSTIIFQPGKLANMGMPTEDGSQRKKIPEVCTDKDTRCMPDLGIKRQRCIHHRTHSLLNKDYVTPEEDRVACPGIERDYEDCKDCPQMDEKYTTHYAAFTGGCLDQMHSYRTAAGPAPPFGIPRETGCAMQ